MCWAGLNSKKQTTDPKTQKREAGPKTEAGDLPNPRINLCPGTRRVPKELLLPPRRAPGARNGALVFILGTLASLIS